MCFKRFKSFPRGLSYLTLMTFSLASCRRLLMTGPLATFPAISLASHPRHLCSSHSQPLVVSRASMLLPIPLPLSLEFSFHICAPRKYLPSFRISWRVSASINLSLHPPVFDTILPSSPATMQSGGPLPRLLASPGQAALPVHGLLVLCWAQCLENRACLINVCWVTEILWKRFWKSWARVSNVLSPKSLVVSSTASLHLLPTKCSVLDKRPWEKWEGCGLLEGNRVPRGQAGSAGDLLFSGCPCYVLNFAPCYMCDPFQKK